VSLLFLLAATAAPSAAGDGTMRGLIIRGPKPYDAMVATVRSLGGEVTQRYENVDAIAASVPEGRLAELAALVGPGKISKDAMIARPHSVSRPERYRPGGADAITQAVATRPLGEAALAALPADYLFNNDLIGATALHAQGVFGQGVTVAIIDAGTANSDAVPALAGRVIGGENLVTADPILSATSRLNDHHGTWVGTVIAGNVVFGYSPTGSFVAALQKYAPGSILGDCPDPTYPVPVCWVPQVGVAPLASLYALKVFDSRGGGAPESRIMAAMDRAITLRHNFNQGAPSAPVSGSGTEDSPYVYDSLNIQVVNMSLGGGTIYAGRDLEDRLTVKMLEEGIVLASSAGNDGFGAMTVGSPGSGFGSITVGAANDPLHERIWAEASYGVGIGDLYRPTTHVQTADFSSRGPDADGRFDPDVVANGVATWAEGTCIGISPCTTAPSWFVWGTSFSSPTVAGGAALLRQAFPQARTSEVREAIVNGANPRVLGDRSGRIDQGSGYLDLAAAAARLDDLWHGRWHFDARRSHPTPFVAKNIERIGFEPVPFRGHTFTTHVRNLVPGQVKQFFVESDPFTDEITVDLTNITPELPSAQQNQLFGDDVYFKVVDAPTSFQDRNITDFAKVDSHYVLDNPQTGLVRVSLQGDWTNAGRVSADLRITRTHKGTGRPSATGQLRQGDIVPFEVVVPAGAAQAVFETQWVRNWSMYPTSDVDMLLIGPDGVPDTTGATLASPERVVIKDPKPGPWTILVSAYAVPAEPDFFSLFAQADGVRLRVSH
jgi:subtilisin family serine protease